LRSAVDRGTGITGGAGGELGLDGKRLRKGTACRRGFVFVIPEPNIPHTGRISQGRSGNRLLALSLNLRDRYKMSTCSVGRPEGLQSRRTRDQRGGFLVLVQPRIVPCSVRKDADDRGALAVIFDEAQTLSPQLGKSAPATRKISASCHANHDRW